MDNDKITRILILATISNGHRYVDKAFTNYLFACDYIEDKINYFVAQGYAPPEIQRIADPYATPTDEPTIIEVYRLRHLINASEMYILELYSVAPFTGTTPETITQK